MRIALVFRRLGASSALVIWLISGAARVNAAPEKTSELLFRHAAWIEAVDPANSTLDLRVKDKSYRFHVVRNLVETRIHSPVLLASLRVDEWIQFVSRPRSDGSLEIISLIVIPPTKSETGAESGGGPDASAGGSAVAARSVGGGFAPALALYRKFVVTPFQ